MKTKRTCHDELLFNPKTRDLFSACRVDYFLRKKNDVLKGLHLVKMRYDKAGNRFMDKTIKKVVRVKDLADVV